MELIGMKLYGINICISLIPRRHRSLYHIPQLTDARLCIKLCVDLYLFVCTAHPYQYHQYLNRGIYIIKQQNDLI